MKIMKNFTPSVKQMGDIAVLVFSDEDGKDWYEAQKEFSKTSLKFMFDARGNIIAASWDASMLAPDNLSVSEIKKSSVPVTFFEAGTRWVFDGKKIIPFSYSQEELQQQAEDERARLISDAKGKIVVSQTKLVLGRTLTDKQTTSLNMWLDYIDALEELDLTESSINWPPFPADK
ncbi:phage tail protein [Buttiauxella sp. 3AFRM03]|uniref:tail fiber assembly protein n=1 Tax=Buttiauxella sp. 3AFRM03 TaxID=2479367 RepID=UPI000EF76143|nr:tail fiber assembly protein [Buttiauxella sp. 3AFRM03]AYN29718.1 phage tail protein [Buttiauxella sp. 3AFRM03]